MLLFTVNLLTFAISLLKVVAAPSPAPGDTKGLVARNYPTTVTSEGYKDGFYYQWYTDGGPPATFTNGPYGQFECAILLSLASIQVMLTYM